MKWTFGETSRALSRTCNLKCPQNVNAHSSYNNHNTSSDNTSHNNYDTQYCTTNVLPGVGWVRDTVTPPVTLILPENFPLSYQNKNFIVKSPTQRTDSLQSYSSCHSGTISVGSLLKNTSTENDHKENGRLQSKLAKRLLTLRQDTGRLRRLSQGLMWDYKWDTTAVPKVTETKKYFIDFYLPNSPS